MYPEGYGEISEKKPKQSFLQRFRYHVKEVSHEPQPPKMASPLLPPNSPFPVQMEGMLPGASGNYFDEEVKDDSY